METKIFKCSVIIAFVLYWMVFYPSLVLVILGYMPLKLLIEFVAIFQINILLGAFGLMIVIQMEAT